MFAVAAVWKDKCIEENVVRWLAIGAAEPVLTFELSVAAQVDFNPSFPTHPTDVRSDSYRPSLKANLITGTCSVFRNHF